MVTGMPDNVVSLTSRGKPTEPEVKEEAFRLWVSYGRSPKRVSEKLGIDERTIHRWRVADGWEERRQNEAAAFLPGATVEGAIALRLAAHNAAILLQQMTFEAMEHGTPIDDRQAKALTAIAQAGGYAPSHNTSPVDTHTAAAIAGNAKQVKAEDVSGLSPDDLLRMEQDYRRKRRS